jgi:hypothetical protein
MPSYIAERLALSQRPGEGASRSKKPKSIYCQFFDLLTFVVAVFQPPVYYRPSESRA